MAPITNMPAYGCEHLGKDQLGKIDEYLKSSTFDPAYVQYTCISCPTTASFPNLDKHFTKTKHDFAISQKSIYCGQCRDLVYEPSILFPGKYSKKRKLVQLSKDDEDYIAANTTQRPCGREGVRGLFNLGETCYMNAVLQMMVHNQLLASYFLGMGHPLHICPISKEPEKKNESDDSDDELNGDEKEQKTCVACGMTELFADSHALDQTLPAHAVNLLFASWKNIPHMSGKGQQDAQEWFMIIVDKLHEAVTNPAVISANAQSTSSNSVNGVNPATKDCKDPRSKKHCNCFFHKVFYGRFYSDVTCDTCHNLTRTEEEYSSLSLDFKKQAKRKKKEANSTAKDSKDKDKDSKSSAGSASNVPNLYDCLKTYTAPETLSSEIYTCPSCKTNRSATKHLRICKLPALLCVHVKRFGMKKINGQLSGVAEKYEGKLDFPLSLDMGPYSVAAGTKGERGEFVYDLNCVVVHQGEHSHTGHYFAFCRVGGGGGGGVGESATTSNNSTTTTGAKSDTKNGSGTGHLGGTNAGEMVMPGGKWYRFDDEIVSATTTEDVLRQEAYLLFYGLRRIDGEGDGDGDGVGSGSGGVEVKKEKKDKKTTTAAKAE